MADAEQRLKFPLPSKRDDGAAPFVYAGRAAIQEQTMALDSSPTPAFAGPQERQALFAHLQAWLGNRFSQAQAVREQHGHTLTWLENQPPEAVAFPQSADEVVEIVKRCNEARIPLIAFGAGTSLEGHLNAPFGGIALDFSRMTKIVRVNGEDLDCEVEAGITRKALNESLRDTGLFFPVDPGADATIGGMAATRASGTCAVRYGTMRENVVNITAVLANGEVVRTGARTRKSSAGYDLTRLIVGSEGTLGIITQLTVRLYGIPEAVVSATCPFSDLEGACRASTAAIQLGLSVARIELLDPLQIRMCNSHSKLSLPEVPTLFLEFHGTPAGTREQTEIFAAIAEENGGGPLSSASQAEERAKLWQARHDVYWAQRGYIPGKTVLVTDVCVPISNLAQCVKETQQDIERLNLVAPIVGHVGDGNFHVVPLVDLNDDDEVRRVKLFSERLVERALAFEGTCTGEHGIGQGKRDYLQKEAGSGIEIMRVIKRALDPCNILNPGKII
jgi:D-lactate dehydrogenase (cytochrome)